MPKPTVVIAVVAAVVLLAAAGLLASVLRDDGPPAPPQGYATFSAKVGERTVSFAYPKAWGAVERSREKGVDIFRVFGPPDADGARSVVRATAEPGTTVSFASQYGLIDGNDRLQLANVREVAVEDVDVPGAQEGRRRVLEYDYKKGSGGAQRSRSSTVFALAADGLFVNVVADTPAATPEVDGDAVVASLTLDG